MEGVGQGFNVTGEVRLRESGGDGVSADAANGRQRWRWCVLAMAPLGVPSFRKRFPLFASLNEGQERADGINPMLFGDGREVPHVVVKSVCKAPQE